MPSWVRRARPLVQKYGLRWGGTFSTTPDPMHFEFMGTPADAARITAKLRQEELTIVDAATKKYFEAKFKQTNDLATDLFRVTDHGTEDAGRANHHQAIREEVKDLRKQVNEELTRLHSKIDHITKSLERIAPARTSRD
jgi:small-conductance mechanosensitive channel